MEGDQGLSLNQWHFAGLHLALCLFFSWREFHRFGVPIRLRSRCGLSGVQQSSCASGERVASVQHGCRRCCRNQSGVRQRKSCGENLEGWVEGCDPPFPSLLRARKLQLRVMVVRKISPLATRPPLGLVRGTTGRVATAIAVNSFSSSCSVGV